MKSRHFRVFGAVFGAVSLASAATAAPVTQDFGLGFSAASQSLFGPGQSLGSLGQSNSISGGGFSVSASSGVDAGTVNAGVNGQLSVGFENVLSLGAASSATFDFHFSGGSSVFNTGLGAFAKVTAGFTLPSIFIPPFGPTIPSQPVSIPLLDLDYSLNTNPVFTATLGGGATGTDKFTAAQPGIGPDIAGVVAARAGVDLNVTQSSTLNLNGLHGTVRATNLDTATVVTGTLSLGASANQSLNLDLSEVGTWSIELLDLDLDNLFANTLGLSLDPFVYYLVGVNCGSPTSGSDNGIGCIANNGRNFSLASFPLFSTDPFALEFNTIDTSAFLVEVVAPTGAADEPAALGAVLAGLAGFALMRRRVDTRAAAPRKRAG